ncbi:type VI secretion system contractile sheath small subunit [Pirellulales bacterium]|nr:type VI secretion system contractile sheath small subunit [Pirellulales bacterium]
MGKASSQKFIGRNRAPRVQIEYDVEVYGAEKTIQLPFVMGVMSDLSGKPEEALPGVADRKFLEIDIDNFDDRLKSMKPRTAFAVPNTLTGEGNLMVDITFESMDDFSPAAVARKIEPLRKLLETRTQLANLMTWMDGKQGAEDLIGKLLQDQSLLSTLASSPAPDAPPAAPPTPPPAPPAAPVAAAPTPTPTPPAPTPDPTPAPPAAAADESEGQGDGSDDLDDLLGSL